MDYSEKYGKDVDEAVRLALMDLGLGEDDVIVTVLEEPKKGFFGLNEKLAKVRVEKAPCEKEAKAPSEENEPRVQDKPNEAPPEEREFNNKHLKEELISTKPTDLVEDNESVASKFVKQLMSDMKLDVEIEAYKNEECYYLEIQGKDSRIVIGKRGQALDAIQYITSLVVNKELNEYVRVIIDVEGYRSRREKTLETLADKLARKAQKTGKSVKLEPMNPYERKIIHATLQGYEGIATKSEGEEPYRRIIIEKE